MKLHFSGATLRLSGALTLGALALAGCGGGGSNGGNSGGGNNGGGGSNLLNTIVFVSNRDGNDEIYSMSSTGSQQTRLTNSAQSDNSPSRSRDGNRIVFSSNRDGNPEIYLMGIAGETSSLQRLTTDGVAPPDDTAPDFSADGTKIAWISTRGGDANVWLMDSSGANQRQLTTEGKITSVAFSPDGTEVAFSVARTANAIIVVRNIATGAERIVAQGAFSALAPRYSPNGTQLVFTARTPASDARRLRLVNLATGVISDGPGQGNGAGNFELSAAFSPDGTRLAFEVAGTQSPQIGTSTSLTGTDVTVLTSLGTNFSPSWGQ